MNCMVRYWGVNAFGHDASLCVVENDMVIFHKLSGGEFLTEGVVDDALSFGKPDVICYYENPLLKRTRQLYSGEWNKAFNMLTPKLHMLEFGINCPIKYVSHHHSHAAASYLTSELNDAIILVADAIGEWETVTVWHAVGNNLTKLDSHRYPFSLGLFYTAFSKLYGVSEREFMKLSVDEYPIYYVKAKKYLDRNLHRGIKDWGEVDKNLPASVQKVFVDALIDIVKPFKGMSNNLLMAGGCAFNELAVKQLNARVTISPGDSSSSIGAVAAYLNKRLKGNK